MQLDISDTVKDANDLKYLLTEHPWKMLMQHIHGIGAHGLSNY